MRISLGGIEHETNTYASGSTTLEHFYVQRGERLFRASGQESIVGGAVDACAALAVEAVPLLHAFAQPSGTIDYDSYTTLKTELLQRLADAGPLDGCVWLLHGAGVVDGIEDLEADLLEDVRALLGPDVPMVGAFDLHGNVTQRMADCLQGVFACRQYPHVDLHEQSRAAVQLVTRIVQEGLRPTCTVLNLPLLLPTTTTFEGIGAEMVAAVLQAERASDAINVSWFHGFPFTDIDPVGASIVVTSTADSAESIAKAVARTLWDRREAFLPTLLDGPAAVTEALRLVGTVEGPVVINETSDNCGAGTPGDGTHLLRAMLEAELGERACFGFVVDPQTVAQAEAAGIGREINVELGGKTDALHGEPLRVRARVRALSDGRLVLQHMFKGAPLNIGPVARLEIDGMDVVVGSRRSQTLDREPFLCVGIDVERYDIVALKSSNHFRAGFQALAGAIVTADTPGLSSNRVELLPRQRTTRRLWPLADDVAFDP